MKIEEINGKYFITILINNTVQVIKEIPKNELEQLYVDLESLLKE